jgi:ubiquinone/menaquinone biosynthesis C-methylase UbiE
VPQTILSTPQNWQDREYCKQYADTWEISTYDVHYGWLADGESKLKLLSDIDIDDIEGAAVLDVGCGMGENLFSLLRRGAKCFGIDISEHMLKYARGRSPKISLVQQDMREFSAFPGVSFDIILSIYSLEYLESLKDFRDVLSTLFSRLQPGGVRVFVIPNFLRRFAFGEK